MNAKAVANCLVVIAVLLCSERAASAQGLPTFNEVNLFSGGTLSPDGTLLGGGFGLGSGRGIVSLEGARTSLGSEAIGVGNAITPLTGIPVYSTGYPASSAPISHSVLITIAGKFRYDLLTLPHATVYGVTGLQYFKNRATDSLLLGSGAVPLNPTLHVSTLGFGLGAGLRVPLRHGFGVRAEATFWTTRSGSGTLDFPATYGPGTMPLATPTTSNSLPQFTVGFYYRWLNHL